MNDSKEEKASGCSNKREATIALKNKTHRQASELNRLNCQYKHAKEELTRLKELNREMVEALKTALECLEMKGFGKSYVEDVIKRTLKKSRGEGE